MEKKYAINISCVTMWHLLRNGWFTQTSLLEKDVEPQTLLSSMERKLLYHWNILFPVTNFLKRFMKKLMSNIAWEQIVLWNFRSNFYLYKTTNSTGNHINKYVRSAISTFWARGKMFSQMWGWNDGFGLRYWSLGSHTPQWFAEGL